MKRVSPKKASYTSHVACKIQELLYTFVHVGKIVARDFYRDF